MAWVTPIYNRTVRDVEYVKEINEKIYNSGINALTTDERNKWLNGLIGALNPQDLNRIEGNIEYVYQQLVQYAYIPPIRTIKTDWDFSDLNDTNSIDSINRIATNALSLIEAYYATETQPPDNLENPTYEDINRLEKFLIEIKHLIELMVLDFKYSGTMYSGQVIVLPQNGGA